MKAHCFDKKFEIISIRQWKIITLIHVDEEGNFTLRDSKDLTTD
jgi:hypothetical protein